MTQVQTKTYKGYGDSNVNNQICKKWFAKSQKESAEMKVILIFTSFCNIMIFTFAIEYNRSVLNFTR